jgi:hypothetical protein
MRDGGHHDGVSLSELRVLTALDVRNHKLSILIKLAIVPSEAAYIITSYISPNIKTTIANITTVEELWGKHPIVRDEKLRQFVGECIPLPREPLHGYGYPINQAEPKEAFHKLISC